VTVCQERRQHADRVEGAAEECQRRDDEQRHDLQLLETVRPDADDETSRLKVTAETRKPSIHTDTDAQRY
jgi:hypothetical protein